VFSGAGLISGPNTTLTKTNSGNLTILNTNAYAGATTFAGGVVDVLDLENGGTPSPLGSSPADPTSLVFNGGTLEYLGGNKTIDHGATFQTNGGTLSITNGTTLTMGGTLTGVGALAKIGNGQLTLTVPNNYLGGTIISAGTIRAAQGSSATISALGTNTITLNGNTSAATFLFGGDAEVLNNPLHIVNTNNFISNGGNDQVLDVTGSGLVNLEGTGANVLTFAGDMTTFNGIFNLDTLANARFLPNSGTLVGGPNVIFNLGTGSGFLNNRNGNLTVLLASLFGGTSTTVQGASSTDNRPTTYIVGLNNANNEFDGRFTEVSAARKVNLVKSGTGTFTLVQSQPYTGFTTISNGVLALAFGTNTTGADGSLDNTTNIEVTATGILDVSGRSDATLQLGGSQTLAGSGTVRGAANISGVLAPDGGTPNTLGTLTVTNFVNLFSTTWMKLNRGTAPNSDKLVAPSINMNGTLVITNIGAPLHPGDTFTLFQGTLANSFGTVILPNYYTFDTTQLPVNGTVTVTSYTPPVLTTDFSTFSSGTITFNITGGIAGNGVSVLTSTNIALPLTNWTAAASGNFDGSGNFSAPVTVDPASPQQFYIMATQ
jgi:autotransporter-associated beta strand protein